MADGTSATGMDWMDLNVQLGLVATGRGKATNSSSKGISPQVTRDRIQKRQLPCDKQPGDNVQRGHWDWGNIPFARCQHPEQEQAPSQSIAAGTWAGHHCCWEEGDCHQLMAPASLQQQHKAQQLLPAQPSLNCCHCTREKGREGQVLPHVWDERSGAGSSQPRAGGCNFQQGGHCCHLCWHHGHRPQTPVAKALLGWNHNPWDQCPASTEMCPSSRAELSLLPPGWTDGLWLHGAGWFPRESHPHPKAAGRQNRVLL